VTYFSNFETP